MKDYKLELRNLHASHALRGFVREKTGMREKKTPLPGKQNKSGDSGVINGTQFVLRLDSSCTMAFRCLRFLTLFSDSEPLLFSSKARQYGCCCSTRARLSWGG